MCNRYLCDVLREMRVCHETRNYSYLMGLIEEVQVLGNRMEAGLGDKHDVASYREERSRLKKEILELKKEKNTLNSTLSKDTKDNESLRFFSSHF